MYELIFFDYHAGRKVICDLLIQRTEIINKLDLTQLIIAPSILKNQHFPDNLFTIWRIVCMRSNITDKSIHDFSVL